MMDRVLEPEVMDTPEEARDYDAMDHGAVNARFCEDFLSFIGSGAQALRGGAGRIVDFGTGTALIPIELCGRRVGFTVVAIDLAENMLALARVNVARAKLGDRVLLERVDAKGTPYDDGAFGATISNSIVHHIPAPERCLAEMWRVTAKGGVLFVRDLHRPSSAAEVDRLVALYASGPTAPTAPGAPGSPSTRPLPATEARLASFDNQRALFRASLCAAMTVPEVVALVAPLGVPASAVQMTSDRHWTLAYEKR